MMFVEQSTYHMVILSLRGKRDERGRKKKRKKKKKRERGGCRKRKDYNVNGSPCRWLTA